MPEKWTRQEMWREILSGHLIGKALKYRRRLLSLIPADRRCKSCNAPFDHVGAVFMPLIGHGQYRKTPRFCNF